jgi:galactokinase
MKTFTFFSPGRINLLGEHIDYNGGNVLPAPLDLGIQFSANQRKDSLLSIRSDLDGSLHILKNKAPNEAPFLRYFQSVLDTRPDGVLPPLGWHFELTSTLPPGAGLSSSSALTCGFIYALLQIGNLSLEPDEIINWSVRAEHGAGVIGGRMDQTCIFLGQKGHFLLLDCSTNKKKYVPFHSNHVGFLLFDLQLPHQLVDSEYNERRRVCERIISMGGPSPHLAKWSLPDLEKHQPFLSKSDYEKGRFVIDEEARVGSGIIALDGKDWQELGRLMNATHEGLREQYKVSLPEIDLLQARLISHPSVLGARIMGGGFGGCVLALVKTDKIPELEELSKTDLGAKTYPVRFTNGLLRD